MTVTALAAIDESKGYTDAQLTDYSTTAEMNQAIMDALVPYGSILQRDAAITAALVPYSDTAAMNAAIAAALATIDLTPYWTISQVQAAITAALAPVTLSNGQTWNGGPTFNLLQGSNVLRNLSVAGALSASYQNLDDTILETGAAIAAVIDALDLSQFQNEAGVLALIATALHGAVLGPGEVSTYVAGELTNYATSSSVSSSISSALKSYDDSSQVDSGLLHAGRSESGDCKCAGQRGSEQLLHAGRSAELRGQRAAGVLPSDRTRFPADGHLPACTGPAGGPKRRSTTPSPARAS